MLFVKVFSKNVNNNKKYICGVNKTNSENLIRTVGDFYITFDKNTKESFDMYHKDFFYEELSKEEELNYINNLKSLKIIEDYNLSKSIKKISESFDKTLLNEEGKEVYDCLTYLVEECLNNKGIKEDFIIKNDGVYELVSCKEKDYFCLDNFRIVRLTR